MEQEHQRLEAMSSTAPMLPIEAEKVVIVSPKGVEKILVREDTILNNLHGCAGCGRTQFTCGGVKNQCSVLCWGKKSDRKYYCLILLLSFAFVISLIASMFFCFTDTVNDAILNNMIIRQDSVAYELWKRPNVQPLMKVHIFNYTNWEAVLNREEEKFHVESVGPYVYTQQLERVNIEFDDDLLSFQEHNSFDFQQSRTNGSILDKVQVPNLPLIGALAGESFPGAIDTVNSFSRFITHDSTVHPDAFLTVPVTKFLWGYEDSLVTKARQLGRISFSEFGLLIEKNGTTKDRITINTGQRDINEMNIIEKLNEDDQMHTWHSHECNSIRSTDGSIFPPSLLLTHEPLQVFFNNLCRRMPFNYEKDVEIADGVKVLRYTMPTDVFDSTKLENQCYCEISTGTCPPRGIMNVTTCGNLDARVMISFPHFTYGEESLFSRISGLEPDPEKYVNYLDIHPTLGIALSGKSNLQLNIQVVNNASYKLNGFDEGMILPIAWVEMTVEELPESLRSLVYHGTYSTAAVQLGLIVTSLLCLIVSFVCLCYLLAKRKKKPCATIKSAMTFVKDNECNVNNSSVTFG